MAFPLNRRDPEDGGDYVQSGNSGFAAKAGPASPAVSLPAVKEPSPQLTRTESTKPVCPICGAPVTPTPYGWRCLASSGHYWRWRGEQSGVKAFLTQPHPNKQGAFYEQTPAERDAFLAQVHARMFANGYTPYGGGH